LRELQARILAQDPSLAAARPPPVQPAAGPAVPLAVTGNLREQLSGLAGREPELAQPREAEILWAPTALLETKFYVPRPRRGLVSRPRLSERLDRGTASKLVLLSAPAGFGKTTLLTESSI